MSLGARPDATATTIRIDTLRQPSCNVAMMGNAMPITLRATRNPVTKSILMLDALFLSSATPKLDIEAGDPILRLSYLPYAPTKPRVSEVSIKLTRRSVISSLVDESGERAPAVVEKGSTSYVDKYIKRMYGDGSNIPEKAPRNKP